MQNGLVHRVRNEAAFVSLVLGLAVPVGALAQAQAPAVGTAPALAEPGRAKTPASIVAPAPSGEPSVRQGVIEDEGARIDELNVRGAVRSITVRPKGPLRAEYDVLPVDASRDPSDGPSSAKGAQGRRVWRFSF